MSNYIKNTSILDMWNNTDDCDHFIQNVKNKASKLGATVKIHPFILFHPGYNIRGGHRRAVYLVSNSIYSFVLILPKFNIEETIFNILFIFFSLKSSFIKEL